MSASAPSPTASGPQQGLHLSERAVIGLAPERAHAQAPVEPEKAAP